MIEYQRVGRNKDTTINQAYITGGEFRNKFDKIADNKEDERKFELEAQLFVLKEIKKSYDIDFKEVD